MDEHRVIKRAKRDKPASRRSSGKPLKSWIERRTSEEAET